MKERRNKAGDIISFNVIHGGRDQAVEPPKDYEVIDFRRAREELRQARRRVMASVLFLLSIIIWIVGLVLFISWARTGNLYLFCGAILLWISGGGMMFWSETVEED